MEKLYTVSKKQDQEMTVAQIMNTLLPDSDLKVGEKVGTWKK